MRKIFREIYRKDKDKVISLAIMTVSTSALGIVLPLLKWEIYR